MVRRIIAVLLMVLAVALGATVSAAAAHANIATEGS